MLAVLHLNQRNASSQLVISIKIVIIIIMKTSLSTKQKKNIIIICWQAELIVRKPTPSKSTLEGGY